MAVAMFAKRTNSVLLPLLVSTVRLEFIRNQFNMAKHCKAGKSRRRTVKPNPQKLRLADKIREVFESNNMVVICQFSDMNTVEWEDLRYTLGKEEIKVKMFPNRITCKALENTKYREINPLFLASTVVTYSKEAKVKPLLSGIRKQPKMDVLGGKVDNHLLSRKALVDYSKLPSLTEQHVQLLQIVSDHSKRLVTLLEQNQMSLSGNLSQYVEQGQSKS